MKCKKCKEKDKIIELKDAEIEKIVKLNGEILELARSINNSNGRLVDINKKLLARVDELETKLKEGEGESCSNVSEDA